MSETHGTEERAYEGGTLSGAGPAGAIMVPPSYEWTNEAPAPAEDTPQSEQPGAGPHPWGLAPGSYIGTGPTGPMFLPG